MRQPGSVQRSGGVPDMAGTSSILLQNVDFRLQTSDVRLALFDQLLASYSRSCQYGLHTIHNSTAIRKSITWFRTLIGETKPIRNLDQYKFRKIKKSTGVIPCKKPCSRIALLRVSPQRRR